MATVKTWTRIVPCNRLRITLRVDRIAVSNPSTVDAACWSEVSAFPSLTTEKYAPADVIAFVDRILSQYPAVDEVEVFDEAKGVGVGRRRSP